MAEPTLLTPHILSDTLSGWLARKSAKLRDLAHVARVSEKVVSSWIKQDDLPDHHTFTRLRRAIPKLNGFVLPPVDVIEQMRQVKQDKQTERREGESAKPAEAPPPPPTRPKFEPLAFGLAVRHARDQASMSVKDLAATLDVHQSAIYRWEQGQPITPECYDKVVTLMPELKLVPAPIYKPRHPLMIAWNGEITPAESAPPASPPPAPPSTAAATPAPPEPPPATKVSPMQAAVAATPWVFPRVSDLVGGEWANHVIVSSHALDRFAERYLKRAPLPTDRAQLGHLVWTSWKRGFFEKIEQGGETFFALAIPGTSVGEVYYALLREDQVDPTPSRLVVITVLTAEMRDSRASWDALIHMPFQKLVQEAGEAQKLVPPAAAAKTPAAAPVAAPVPAPAPAPAMRIRLPNPGWLNAARSAAPWSPPVLPSNYTWQRFMLPEAVNLFATQYLQLTDEPNSGRVASQLDYVVAKAMDRGLAAVAEWLDETWALVALPPIARHLNVCYAIVRKNPLTGTDRHKEVICAIVSDIEPEQLKSAMTRIARTTPAAKPPKPATPTTPPVVEVRRQPAPPSAPKPAPPPPVAQPAPKAAAPADGVEDAVRALTEAYKAKKAAEAEVADLAEEIVEIATVVERAKQIAEHLKKLIAQAEEAQTSLKNKLNDATTSLTSAKDAIERGLRTLADA
jgi:DNA-binding XRE family transcriptional regulator